MGMTPFPVGMFGSKPRTPGALVERLEDSTDLGEAGSEYEDRTAKKLAANVKLLRRRSESAAAKCRVLQQNQTRYAPQKIENTNPDVFSKNLRKNARFLLTRFAVHLRCGEKWYEVENSRVK